MVLNCPYILLLRRWPNRRRLCNSRVQRSRYLLHTFLLGLRMLLHSLGNVSTVVNHDRCDRWLLEAPEAHPHVLLPIFSRLDSPKRSCGGAVGAGLQASIVGICCVSSGIAHGKAATRVIAGAKSARMNRIDTIVLPYTQLFEGSRARYS